MTMRVVPDVDGVAKILFRTTMISYGCKYLRLVAEVISGLQHCRGTPRDSCC